MKGMSGRKRKLLVTVSILIILAIIVSVSCIVIGNNENIQLSEVSQIAGEVNQLSTSGISNKLSIVSTETVFNPGLGDVDGDGYITMVDGQLTGKIAVGALKAGSEVMIGNRTITITEEAIERADIDQSGYVDATDASIMQTYYAGIMYPILAEYNWEIYQEIAYGGYETFELIEYTDSGEFVKVDNSNVTWEITDEDGGTTDIATVNTEGLVTKEVIGKGHLKATYEGEYTQLIIKTINELTIVSTSTASNPGLGDVDGDGYITMIDGRLIASFAVGALKADSEVTIGDRKITITEEAIERGDIDGDGHINASDATIINTYYAGIIHPSIAEYNWEIYQEFIKSGTTETFELIEIVNSSDFRKIDNSNITWEVLDEEGNTSNIATVDTNGQATKGITGKGYLKATYNGENTSLAINNQSSTSIDISIVSTSTVSNPEVGDVDGDGYITGIDAKLVQMYLSPEIEEGSELQIGSRTVTITAEAIERMDFNDSAGVQINDAAQIQQYYNNNTGNDYQEIAKRNNSETFELIEITSSNEFKKIDNSNVSWTVTNEQGSSTDIATVDDNGQVTKGIMGNGYLTAIYNEEYTRLPIKTVNDLSIVSTSTVSNPEVGDVDGDGYITYVDARLIALKLANGINEGSQIQIGDKTLQITEEVIHRMDMDGDTDVDTTDGLMISRIIEDTSIYQEIAKTGNSETFELIEVTSSNEFKKVDNSNVTWEVTNEEGNTTDIATINNGQLTINKVGKVHIKATYYGKETKLLMEIVEEQLETYKITYELNGGSVSGNPSTYTSETETITLKNPTRSGYTFIGWTGSNGTTPQMTVTIPKGSTGDKEYTANWRLIDTGDDAEIISSDVYEIDYENLTIRIPSETSVNEYYQNISINGEESVIIKNEEEINGEEYIGTESTITIYKDGNDTEGTTYTFEVINDVTGDGRANVTDIIRIRAHIVEVLTLEGRYKVMADTNEDGTINITDVLLLRSAIAGNE